MGQTLPSQLLLWEWDPLISQQWMSSMQMRCPYIRPDTESRCLQILFNSCPSGISSTTQCSLPRKLWRRSQAKCSTTSEERVLCQIQPPRHRRERSSKSCPMREAWEARCQSIRRTTSPRERKSSSCRCSNKALTSSRFKTSLRTRGCTRLIHHLCMTTSITQIIRMS